MKRFIIIAILLCIPYKIFADGINAVNLWLTHGKHITYLLCKEPIITFQGEEFILTTQNSIVSYPAKDILKYTFSKIEPDAIDSYTKEKAYVVVKDANLIGRNLDPTSNVVVYSVDGSILSSAMTDEKGNVSISLPKTPNNIYVIKTSVATFKIRKQ